MHQMLRFPAIAVPSGHMNSGFGGRNRRRLTRIFPAVFVLTIIIICTYWKQQSPIAGVLMWDSPSYEDFEHQRAKGPQDLLQISNDNDGQLPAHPAQEGPTKHHPDKDSHHASQEESHENLAATNGANIQPVVGKVTISFGEPDEVYDRAIRSHEYHNKRMGYPQFVERERLLSGLWSKHAYIFSVIVQELSKPEGQRLKWLMWLDRDTVLMNPFVQLEIFIPPSGFEHIHLLITNDRNGLNNGVFFLKVNDWSLKLFATALTFPHYKPDIKLKYTEQSSMEEVLQDEWYNKSTVRVPQRWFNAFPPPSNGKLHPNHGRPGQLLLHFASNRDGLRSERMTRWMDVADQETSEWKVPLNETSYPYQIDEYWRRLRNGEDTASIIEALEKER